MPRKPCRLTRQVPRSRHKRNRKTGPRVVEFTHKQRRPACAISLEMAEGESVGSDYAAKVRTNGLASAAFAGNEAARLFLIPSGEHSL